MYIRLCVCSTIAAQSSAASSTMSFFFVVEAVHTRRYAASVASGCHVGSHLAALPRTYHLALDGRRLGAHRGCLGGTYVVSYLPVARYHVAPMGLGTYAGSPAHRVPE